MRGCFLQNLVQKTHGHTWTSGPLGLPSRGPSGCSVVTLGTLRGPGGPFTRPAATQRPSALRSPRCQGWPGRALGAGAEGQSRLAGRPGPGGHGEGWRAILRDREEDLTYVPPRSLWPSRCSWILGARTGAGLSRKPGDGRAVPTELRPGQKQWPVRPGPSQRVLGKWAYGVGVRRRGIEDSSWIGGGMTGE